MADDQAPPVRPVVIVGAGGFIGRMLTARLAERGLAVRAVLRRPLPPRPGIEDRVMGTLTEATDWLGLFAGAGAVVHLASRAHAPLQAGADEAWIDAEAAMTAALARAAATVGVERIVLMSSIKVLGDATHGVPFRATDRPAPDDSYGRGKQRLEDAMRGAAPDLPMAVLRPPLVYGPGVKANFLALLRLVDRGLPLPLASTDNRRAFIFVDNLIDLAALLVTRPEPASGIFLLRDAEEVSTASLIREIARGLDRPARLFPFPPALLHGMARLTGHAAAAERLLGSLQVDDDATRTALGWHPPHRFAEGIAATCRWYRASAPPPR